MAVKKVSKGIPEVEALINERWTNKDNETWEFELIGRRSQFVQPKQIVSTKSGAKVKMRYLPSEESPFVDKQEVDNKLYEKGVSGIEPVKIDAILLDEITTVRDRSLAQYLLANKYYGVQFRLHDPENAAREDAKAVDYFDDVWGELKGKSSDEMRAIYLMLTSDDNRIGSMSNSEIKMKLRSLAESDTEGVEEVMNSPIVSTMYLYHVGVQLGLIEYIKRTGEVRWVESKIEIVRVPAGESPMEYFGKALIDDEHLEVRKKLESEIND